MSINNYIFNQHFEAFTTLVVGAAAYIVYVLEKTDRRVKATRLIIGEIREAESKIEEIKQVLNLKEEGAGIGVDYPSLLPTNSWKEYSYLFTDRLDTDQFQAVNKFYEVVEAIKFIIEKDNSLFWENAEQRSRVINDRVSEFIFSHLDPKTQKLDEESNQDFDKKLTAFVGSLRTDYRPQKVIIF